MANCEFGRCEQEAVNTCKVCKINICDSHTRKAVSGQSLIHRFALKDNVCPDCFREIEIKKRDTKKSRLF